MAYCVHCGVKLHEGEKRCPLCGTVSIDPNEQPVSDARRTYPVRTPEQDLKRGKQFFLVLEAVLLLVPAGLNAVLYLFLLAVFNLLLSALWLAWLCKKGCRILGTL